MKDRFQAADALLGEKAVYGAPAHAVLVVGDCGDGGTGAADEADGQGYSARGTRPGVLLAFLFEGGRPDVEGAVEGGVVDVEFVRGDADDGA